MLTPEDLQAIKAHAEACITLSHDTYTATQHDAHRRLAVFGPDEILALVAEVERLQSELGRRPRKPVTFRCSFCGTEVTELHGAGKHPRYCQMCSAEATRSLSRQRAKAQRARKKEPR